MLQFYRKEAKQHLEPNTFARTRTRTRNQCTATMPIWKQCTACTIKDVTNSRYTTERPSLLHRQLMSVFVSAGLISAPAPPATLRKSEARSSLGVPHTHTLLLACLLARRLGRGLSLSLCLSLSLSLSLSPFFFLLGLGVTFVTLRPSARPTTITMLLLSGWLWGLKNDGNERRNQSHVSEQQAPSLYTKPTPNPRPGLISAPLWQPSNQPT